MSGRPAHRGHGHGGPGHGGPGHGGADLLAAVLASADRTPTDPALTFAGRTLTHGQLAARIRAVSGGLRAEGLAHGDRVLFSVRPGQDAVVLALGIVHAGGVVVFADPGAGEALFRARTALAAPRWVAAESVLYLASSRPLRSVARRRGLELAPYAQLVPDARHVYAGRWLPGVPRGAIPLRALARARGSTHLETDSDSATADADALIIFTSGTTGVPKAVVHTRASLGAGLTDFADAVGIRAGQRVLTDQLMVGVPALIAGAHWTMPPYGTNPGARPEQYLSLLPDAELLFAVPAALDAILRSLEAHPELMPPRLDTIVIGGAPVLRPLLARTVERFPSARIRAVYGMTEILPVAIADGVEKLAATAQQATANQGVNSDAGDPEGGDPVGDPVGRLVSSVSARIVEGELVLSGPGLARGYLAELPQRPLTELRTGDLARLDEAEGGTRLTLLGRSKDMFIRGTQNVYPGLYEPVMAGLPGVAEVAMVGVPDAIGDDRIVVVVVPVDEPPVGPTAGHPLVAVVRRALPGLIDAGVLPDAVLAVPQLPRSGRGRKLDRVALTASIAPHLRALLEEPAGPSE